LVSFCDFIYTWLFVAGLAWLRLRVRKVIKDTNNKVVRASDYTVYIKSGLPAVCAVVALVGCLYLGVELT